MKFRYQMPLVGFAATLMPWTWAPAAPVVTGGPVGTLELLSGVRPVFQVVAVGSGAISYAWRFNGAPVTGNPSASTAALSLNSARAGSYAVAVSDSTGTTVHGPFTVNVSSAAPADAYAALVLQDGPTNYWRLNETSGTVLRDFGSGRNGSYDVAKVDRNQAASVGLAPDPAVHFKGTAGISASVPYSPALNPQTDWSIEFWVKPDFSGTRGTAILSTQDRDAGRAGYVFYQGTSGNLWELNLGVGNSFTAFSSGTVAPTAGRWDHLVLTVGGETAKFYVNGAVKTTRTLTLRPNLTRALEFGSRFGGGVPYAGNIDEVALYRYELSEEQVLSHYGAIFLPPVVTVPPVPVNAVESGNFTLSATVTGFPNTYVWLKDGNPLDPTERNPNGGLRFPLGVTGTTLTVNGATPLDNGQYTLSIINPLGDSSTQAVTVKVSWEVSPPSVAYVTATPVMGRVRVGFQRDMDPQDVLATGNFHFNGGLTVLEIVPTLDPRVIDIMTNGMIPGNNYTLSMTGLKDTLTNQNVIGPNSTNFQAFVLTKGVLAWDYYREITGSSVSSLQSDSQFPNGTWTHRYLHGFSSMQVTTNSDLGTNPGFTVDPRTGKNLGESYGARVHGWITPTESGNYTFFIRSDDGSQLSLSTNESDENLAIIASEPNCCRPFSGSENLASAPIPLVAGQSYFIEGLYKEGGGGDYIEVAWSKQGALTGTLTPIPARFFSAYAPVLKGLNRPILTGGNQLTLTWPGPGILQEGNPTLNLWTDVPGFPGSGYTTTLPNNTPKKFFRLRQ